MAKIPDNIVSIMMVDNAGAVVSVPVSDFISATTTTVVSAPAVIPSGKAPKSEVINTTIETSVAIEADPNYLVMPNDAQDNLVNTVAYQNANKIGLNTKTPSYLLDVKGDSINIGSSSLTNGFRINSLLVASASPTLKTIYLGDATKLNIISLHSLIISGLIPATATGIDKILFINDLGEVTAKTDIFLESLNTLTNKNQVFAFGTSGTTPNVVSTVVSTTGTHTFNFPLASASSVTAGLISKAQYDIFNAKEPAITAGTASQYYRGDKTFQTLNTTAVAEGTNLYYTDVRARASISGGTGITYSSATGVITNTITQYTDALARASISGGTGITYSSTTGVIINTITQYTDALARAAISGGTGITYNSTTGVINSAITQYTDALARAAISGSTGITYNSTTGVITNNITQYTDALARASISGSTGISYNSTTGVITNTITQYTDALSRASISLTTTGSGAATYNSTTGVLNVPTFTISGLSAGGELSGTYPNPSLLNSAVIGKVLTGYYTSSGIVSATDTILQAFGKVQNQLNSLSGSLSYQGSWNASTNTPTIVSGTGTNGHYYIVNVAGTTTIDGISSWAIGDWIVFNGTTWQKIANQSVTSVNGLSGVVVLTTTNLSEGTNLYYTDARARASISVSGSLSYNSGTGVISYTTPSTTGITEGTNLYYTDARARASISGGTGISYSSSTGIINSTITQYTDALARAAIVGGTGITYNSTTGTINSAITQYTDALARASISGSTGISYNSTTGVITSLITQYTDALARAAISGSASITYNSTTGAISYSGIVYTNASIRALISGGTGITYDSATGIINSNITQYTDALARAAISGSASITYNSTTGVISYTGIVYTNASIRALISGGTGITYDSSTGIINSNITQYTDALARASISGSTGISYNSTTGVILSTITQYTDALARASITGSSSITYNSTTGAISYSGIVYTDASIRALFSATAPLSYSNGVYSISQATTSSNGYLSSTNWNTFNSKENALTFSAPLVRTTNAISITQATTSTNGYLSSTDWNTFNIKQIRIALSTNNSSGAATFNADTGALNIPNYASGVTSIIAGTGITLSPTNGLGNVTVSLTAGSVPSLAQVCAVGSDATSGGTLTANITATAFFEYSDIRHKMVLGENPDVDLSSLDVIKYLRTTHDKDKIRYGYSAQDVYYLCPDLVNIDDSGYLSVNYTDTHTLLILSLQKRIAELERKLNAN